MLTIQLFSCPHPNLYFCYSALLPFLFKRNKDILVFKDMFNPVFKTFFLESSLYFMPFIPQISTFPIVCTSKGHTQIITILKPSKTSFYCVFSLDFCFGYYSPFQMLKKNYLFPLLTHLIVFSLLHDQYVPDIGSDKVARDFATTKSIPPHPEMEQDSMVLAPAPSCPLPACCLWKTLAKE